MSNPISSSSRRIQIPSLKLNTINNHQIRHASLIRRPKRPYTFTQLVTLTDGSTFLHRTTSPLPVYKATKDVRNSPLWNPSSQKLLNVEEDEAGKLAAFRSKFGRGWDALGTEKTESKDDAKKESESEGYDSLLDLISSQPGSHPKETTKDTGSSGQTKKPAKKK